MKRARLIFVAIMLAGLFCVSAAYADTLVLGATFPSFNYSYENINGHSGTGGGSGSIDPSTLNGIALPWVFCTQIEVNILVPKEYATTVNNTGAPLSADVASDVAFLLQSYAKTGMVTDEMTALQAAIWTVIYGDKFHLGTNTAGFNANYATYMLNIGDGNAAAFTWLSPNDGSQDLVTKVPEPSLIMLLGLGLGAVGLLAKKIG
jgi:hypothetical protein